MEQFEAFSAEVWNWVFDRIPGIAARFRDIDRNELTSELDVLLLELRRKPNPSVHDWKRYLVRCLLRRAARVARTIRRRRGFESDLDARQDDVAPAKSSARPDQVALYRRLSNANRHLVKQLFISGSNVSRTAKKLGISRTTIHRRLREMRKTGPNFDFESATPATGPPDRQDRSHLEAVLRSPTATARQLRRARLILDVLDGLTYEQIHRRHGVSTATIARWRVRYGRHGLAGLRARHRGRKPHPHPA